MNVYFLLSTSWTHDGLYFLLLNGGMSCDQGQNRGLGLEEPQEARTLREADTKLRVAEKQGGAGDPVPEERSPASFRGTTSLQALQAARQSPIPPHAQVHKSARFLRPPRPFPGRRRRRLLCEAVRLAPGGCGVPFPALDSCEIATAHQRLSFAVSPSLSCSLSLPSPLPHSSLLRRPKRQAKPAADEGFWDCSVCTFRNSAEAFKCSICDVRKGTSTRKPRINSQLVAQQVAQQYATPPPPKKEKKEKVEKQDKEKPEKDKEISPSVTKKNTNKKTKPKSDILKDPPSEANSIQSANAMTKTSETNHTSRPRLKNVDRSTAQQLAVTVGNVTVIITDFKEKTRSSSTSSSTVTSSAGSEQQHQSSSGSESTDKSSSRSSTPKGDMSAVNDESF
ncbi:RING1 and YY1-binding protein [Suricata suricatta]|uniref:RING1 and YY1-binding protein n=1 Tax=Suricata suricatta TaxID=37032 RepID=UPI0011559565|nr:RING1 and YY1-binding protein [Suricata suricatta]